MSSEFDKGFLKVCCPSPLECLASGSIKQAAPEGTPDREAEARSKIQSTVLSPKLFLNWRSPCPILGKQECCNARPLQIFKRHGHSSCFLGAAHKQDLCKMDIVFRRLLRSWVGPPGAVDWTLPWHGIFPHWNQRIKFFTRRHGSKTWSPVCLGQYRTFGQYVSNLPRERWVVRAVNWFPENARRVGRPALHVGRDDSALLQAQTNSCPDLFFLDELFR